MTSRALAVPRGCGTRKRGAVYGECGLSPWGRPLEHFIIDPPTRVDAAALGLHPIGVTLLADPRTGACHVFDWVGEEHYPGVADFLEEARRFGVSRRLPRTLDFGRLAADSRLVLLHRRAWIDNASQYFDARDTQRWEAGCPKRLAEHVDAADPPPMCAGLWWEDLEPTNPAADGQPRLVRRTMPSFSYVARRRRGGLRAGRVRQLPADADRRHPRPGWRRPRAGAGGRTRVRAPRRAGG